MKTLIGISRARQLPGPVADPSRIDAPVGAGQGSVEAYFGGRGTGKSTLARENAIEDAGPGHLVVYITPNHAASDPWPGEDRKLTDTSAFPYAVAYRGYDVNQVAPIIWRAVTAWRVTLVIDEAHETFPEGFSRVSPAGILFHRGRHLGIRLHVISQWPARVDKRIVRAADVTHWFRLRAAEDLEWLRRRYGDRAPLDVRKLPNYHHIDIVNDDPPPEWDWYRAADEGEGDES